MEAYCRVETTNTCFLYGEVIKASKMKCKLMMKKMIITMMMMIECVKGRLALPCQVWRQQGPRLHSALDFERLKTERERGEEGRGGLGSLIVRWMDG